MTNNKDKRKFQEAKAQLFEKLLALNNDIISIHFRAGHTYTNIRMYRCHTETEVKELAYHEDDLPLDGEPETYVEYTIKGESDDPAYHNQFTFIDVLIVDAKMEYITYENSNVLQATVFHVWLFDGESERHRAMFVFPEGIIMPFPLSLLE